MIYIYNIDYGVFDDPRNREPRFNAMRSIGNDLEKLFGVYTTYATNLFSPT